MKREKTKTFCTGSSTLGRKAHSVRNVPWKSRSSSSWQSSATSGRVVPAEADELRLVRGAGRPVGGWVLSAQWPKNGWMREREVVEGGEGWAGRKEKMSTSSSSHPEPPMFGAPPMLYDPAQSAQQQDQRGMSDYDVWAESFGAQGGQYAEVGATGYAQADSVSHLEYGQQRRACPAVVAAWRLRERDAAEYVVYARRHVFLSAAAAATSQLSPAGLTCSRRRRSPRLPRDRACRRDRQRSRSRPRTRSLSSAASLQSTAIWTS
ncbi:uncharacterized protein C8Q71DRAFT_720547 [Rhodofomes roseus]|uniref:Uncharacterized protein n=1 Tax=Rhodofomes roseus TaxID=34475 RepID=A0ABQ8KW74_9APHY|nr:uncharacterized protein C8Q71DRAFT_720543 [Rhodofomes roseus]XP_047784276.1 uncharacterized protein C8Q71DRAFT_720547 [Rhodofomes roseus]KAH9843224.1 hypothetical protein C8Q71DRAFT_720543 [Rhodofomes roseus]KAH9843229.1 hypothetical protein C8Q71DRAFT_720547 [Rhodofomes roseus]